ncbi:uncharacterized protein [Diadema setosum]|uniref:uncharacterized protein n=1 Tax=Diadema setosum TaxID=31175 RepID=UPI003B3B50F5
MAVATPKARRHRLIGKLLVDITCIAVLCCQGAFLDLFLIHHGDGLGFARGYVWVVVDAVVVVFWLACIALPHLGVRPAAQLPQQPSGNIWREPLFAYASWLVFAPLQIAKVVRIYNTVHKPSEVHWIFTPQMLRIGMSLTSIVFVLLLHSHDTDVDNTKYKVRMRHLGGAIGVSLLDGCDILSMLHIKGKSQEYPPILRNTIMVFGNIWFILPLVPLLSLRVMAAEKEHVSPITKRKLTRQDRNERRKEEIKKLDIKLRYPGTEMGNSNLRPAKSLDYPQFERKVIQLRNDMFVSELSKSCKNRDQRCRSYDNLCGDGASSGKPIAQSKLSQSLNFTYWNYNQNYNQNCKVDAPTLDKRPRSVKERQDKSASFLRIEGDNDVNHHQEKKKDHVFLEAMRHSKSSIFNVILFKNKILVSTMDIPYLAIRLHLWLVHGVSASVFLTKNVLMILGLILHLFYEPPTVVRKAKGKALDVGMMAGMGFP